jgi:hypothetical protein
VPAQVAVPTSLAATLPIVSLDLSGTTVTTTLMSAWTAYGSSRHPGGPGGSKIHQPHYT